MADTRGVDRASRHDAPTWIDRALLAELDGGLWHATDERGWTGIIAEGAIHPDAIPHYANGFCRSIGAVSLFDLAMPDTAAPLSAAHWSNWLGGRGADPRWWFEIDRAASDDALLSPAETMDRWRKALSARSTNLRIIAGLESAYVGSIPLARIVRVLRIQGEEWDNQPQPTT